MPKDGISLQFHTKQVKDLIGDLVRQGNKEVKRGIEQSVLQGLDLMKNDVLNQPGHGETYPSARGTTSAPHVASAPGEAPAPDTNTYRNSWQAKEMPGTGGFTWVLFTADKRGPMLDGGTEGMEARPHVVPWMKRHNVKHVAIMFAALRQAIKRSSQ